jgi:PAS domain S-box-containing protein
MLVGGLWILLSDRAAASIALGNQQVLIQISIYKGWVYVLVTGLLLYWLVHTNNRSLRAANRNYVLLAENISDVVWVLDLDAGRFTYISPSIQHLRGMTPEEALRETPQQALLPESWAHIASALPGRIEEFKSGVSRIYMDVLAQPRKDGSVVWVETTSRFVVNEENGHLEAYAASRDITERRQAEEVLNETQVMLNLAEEVAGVGSWRWDLATQKVTWSEQMFRLFGVEPEDFDGDVNRVIAERIHPDDAAAVQEANRKVLEGADPTPMTYRICLPDRTERIVWVQGRLVADELDTPVALVGYVQDITERVRSERMILQMQRLYATLSQVNQTIVRVQDPLELYRSICHVAVKFGEFTLAWVGLLDETSGDILPVAASGLDVEHWPFPIVNLNDELFAHHLTTLAIRTSSLQTSEDIQSDSRLAAMQATLQQYPFHAAAAVPLHKGGRAIGVLSIVSSEVGFFKAREEQLLLEEMGMDISFALNNIENEKVKRQWADAFEHCAHGIAIGMPSGKILICNPAFSGRQGYTIDEIASKPILEMYAPEEREHVRDWIAEADRSGHVQYETRMVRKDGHVYPVQMDVVSVRDEAGNLLYRVATQQDITERKRAEQALRDSEDKFKYIFDHSPIGNSITTLDGHLSANQAFADMLGYSIEEVQGRTWQELTHPDDVELNRQALEPVLAGEKETARLVKRYLHKNGFAVWVDLSTSLRRDPDGKPLYFISAMINITERRQAEDALRESERQLRALVTSLDDIVLELDEDGIYQNIWTADENLLVRPRAQLLGQSMPEVLGGEVGCLFAESIPRVLSNGTPENIEYPLEIMGSEHWFLARINPIKFGSEVQHTVSLLIRDITDRKVAEEARRASEARFATVFNASPMAIAITGIRDNRLMDVNPAWQTVTGWTRDEVIGHPPDEFILWADPSEREQMVKIMLDKRVVHGFEMRSRKKSGEIVNLLMSAEMITVAGEQCMLLVAQDITERKRTEQEIQKRNADLMLINDLNEAANRGRDLESIWEVLTRGVRNTFAAQDTTVYLLSPDGQYLEMQGSTLPKQVVGQIEKMIGMPIPRVRIPLSKAAYFRKLLSNPQGSIVNDPHEIQQWIREFAETIFLPKSLYAAVLKLIGPISQLLGIRSVLSIPLISSDRTIGLMDITGKGEFAAEDLERARTISRQVTAVILRKQAEEQAQLQLRRLRALTEIDRAINASLDMHLSLDILLNEVLSELNVDAASVLLLNPVSQMLEYVAGKGFYTSHIKYSRMRIGEGLAGQICLERKPLHVFAPDGVDDRIKREKLFKEEQFVEYYGVPLVSKGVLKGVLEVFHRIPLSPDPGWSKFLETLGEQAAIAVNNAQLFEDIQRSNLELVTAYDATIAGWSRAMDLRDKETEGHSQRVTELTLRLAQKMGMDESELQYVRRGSLLHDMGKLGVPDHILFKPGKFTEEEWEIMKRHPTYAHEMLSPIDYLRSAIDIPYCHHEKWDGTGYPRGLKGDQIPLAARLFAIVDVWDALRSDRPYRPSWSTEQARAYIIEQSGKHFDPKVVEAFLEMIEET